MPPPPSSDCRLSLRSYREYSDLPGDTRVDRRLCSLLDDLDLRLELAARPAAPRAPAAAIVPMPMPEDFRSRDLERDFATRLCSIVPSFLRMVTFRNSSSPGLMVPYCDRLLFSRLELRLRLLTAELSRCPDLTLYVSSKFLRSLNSAFAARPVPTAANPAPARPIPECRSSRLRRLESDA